jgi:hypothetical protein
MTFGLAPGYVARTTMVGGTTCGYSLMGRPGKAMSPASRINADSMAAKIGLWMKNRDMFIENTMLRTIYDVI